MNAQFAARRRRKPDGCGTKRGAPTDSAMLEEWVKTKRQRNAKRSGELGRRSQAIQIVFVFTNSRIPAAPSSLPNPERFTPPKGNLGSEATIALTKTIPASSSDTNSSCSLRSFVQALAPSPKVVAFAISTASAASRTRKNDATGPKTSSQYAGESIATSARTVGS